MKFFSIALFFFSGFLFLSNPISKAQVSEKELADHKKMWDIPPWAVPIKNPYANNRAMADSGRVIYQSICSVCHGKTGKGDGVAAAGLSMLPANHTSELVQNQSDGTLFYELSNGHSPMPAYKSSMSEKQRWQLVSFIRTLKPKPKPKK